MGLKGFVFVSVGAMTGSKGIDLLMRAFAAVASQRSDVTLFLKGADGLYQSVHMLDEAIRKLSPRDQQLIADRLVYNGEALSMKQMAALYRSGDAYVSPYRGEGFNMPVLEAAACGVPLIVSGGGTTDDFVTDDFALKIQSRIVPINVGGMIGDQLAPDVDHLVAQMLAVMDREDWRRSASAAGPAHVCGELHLGQDRRAAAGRAVLAGRTACNPVGALEHAYAPPPPLDRMAAILQLGQRPT